MKKNILKKVTAYALTACLCCSVITGCGNVDESTSKTGKESTSTTQSPTGDNNNTNNTDNEPKVAYPGVIYSATGSDFKRLSSEEIWDINIEEKVLTNYDKFVINSSLATFTKSENYLFSPMSLYLALCLCEGISEPEVTEDLLNLLGYDTLDELEESAAVLMKVLSCDEDGKISAVANSIWIDDRIDLSDDAKQVLENAALTMLADIYQSDLVSEDTKNAINSWISDQTDGMITEMPIEPNEETAMTLFNTLLFDKSWEDIIEDEAVYAEEFTCPDGTKMSVDMIHHTVENNPYVKAASSTASAMYYADGSYMIFIKPDAGKSLEDVMNGDLETVISAYRNYNFTGSWNNEVRFKFPVLDYETDVPELENVVAGMGVSSIFDNGAFPAFGDQICVSAIAQKCHIIVDKNGTKAAAVTQISLKDTAMPDDEEPEIIKMDMTSEYAYVIMSAGNIPLFVGSVVTPEA